jgi:hypothetical protein
VKSFCYNDRMMESFSLKVSSESELSLCYCGLLAVYINDVSKVEIPANLGHEYSNP